MAKSFSLALLGAIIGGLLGHFLFGWALKQGFYAMILPGALIGWGASLGRCPHIAIPILCAVLALALSVFTEWRFRPFLADKSFGYFIRHLGDLRGVAQLMIAVGTIMAFWFPFRRRAYMIPNRSA